MKNITLLILMIIGTLSYSDLAISKQTINAETTASLLKVNVINRLAASSISNSIDLNDFDNGGIPNEIDLDDDNDGIIDSLEQTFCNNSPLSNNISFGNISETLFCESDGDGTPNVFDLDSDNDGIPDIEEAGFKHLTAGRGIMDPNQWSDTNANGLHDFIDQLIAQGSYQILDTDGDSVPDFLDLDSDNDGLFDVDEAGVLNGDGDVTGDGVADGIDQDLDGMLDVFDNYVGMGSHTRNFAQISNGNSIPDYQQMNANSGATNLNVLNTTLDIDKDGIIDTRDTNINAIGSPRNLNQKLYVNFDGRNDYASGPQLLNNATAATIMCWIKTGVNSGNSFIVGQENFNLNISGAPATINAKANGISLSSSSPVSRDQWIHITAVYNANSDEKLRIYINGKQENVSGNTALSGSLSNGSDFTIGKSASASQFYKGAIDELRVFNTALTTDQIQKMVFQEIESNDVAIRGTSINRNIDGVNWASLIAYYKMDVYNDDVIENFTSPANNSVDANQMRIYNIKDIDLQQAPMPFTTSQPGKLENAINQNISVNGHQALELPWSIIKIKHNVTLQSNLSNLGLIVEPGASVKLDNNNVLKNSWYLKLDGMIDLQGQSQLVQLEGSELDPTSTGYIERDQQGTVNPFNYNYWCSPVGLINITTNNADFTVGQVLKDGTNPNNPANINWITDINSVASTPISLSSYWIFKYQNVASYFSNWSNVGQSGPLSAGYGFTLKGSNANTSFQNYTFIGKPNNGNIQVPIASGNMNLTGNPYPSALDAAAFITDNLNATNGIIYFWEHFDSNTTHNLQDYQGGYATRSLVGGTPSVSPASISGVGTSDRIPGRFIPVGQGFIMIGNATGGQLQFKNSQRAFVRENNDNSGILFRTNIALAAIPETDDDANNEEDSYETDTFARVRLGFNSDNNYHRQILLGFMDNLATAGIDKGYDAANIDTQTNDMYFMKGNVKMNILGEGFYNEDAIFPLGVKTNQAGTVEFLVDGLENFPSNQRIFIYDNLTESFHNISSNRFEIFLPAGTVNDRFSLRFTDGTQLSASDLTIQNGIKITSLRDNVIAIQNNLTTAEVQNVTLINMLGQLVASWQTKEMDQKNIQLAAEHLAAGAYIIKVKTTNGDLTRKIVLR